MNPRFTFRGWGGRAAVISLILALAGGAWASDIKVEGKLVWGTNDKASPDPKHKPLNEEARTNLRKTFKWTNYFVVNRQVITVPSRGTNTLQMSKDCAVEIVELAGSRVTAELIGKGKRLNKTTREFAPGQSFVIAGEDKNETAWFVIITDLEETHVPVAPPAADKKAPVSAKK